MCSLVTNESTYLRMPWPCKRNNIFLSRFQQFGNERNEIILTTIGICFRAVSILQSVSPCTLVFGVANRALAHAVAALVALRPLAAVQPAVSGLHAQSMPLSILPLTLEGAATVK